jgi:hypothetical protein
VKPTSVIFLILSVILIAGGAVTCIAAQKMAVANGIELFSQETDENSNGIETHEFSETNTNKITLNLKDVNVNIIGNSEKSYMKLTNFSKNTFEYLISNKNLTVDDSINLFSLFQITTGGIGFNGLRHYILYDRFKDKQKTVDVYISKDDSIKQFDITVDSGIITISGITNQADYILNNGIGDIKMDNIRIISTVTAVIENGNFNIDTASISGNIDIKVNKGNVNAAIKSNNYRGYHLMTANGVINYFGEQKSKYFDIEPLNKTSSFNADVKTGNIIITMTTAIESNAMTIY